MKPCSLHERRGLKWVLAVSGGILNLFKIYCGISAHISRGCGLVKDRAMYAVVGHTDQTPISTYHKGNVFIAFLWFGAW